MSTHWDAQRPDVIDMMENMKAKMVEKWSKEKTKKEKNYTLHVIGAIVVIALVITALSYWFPLN
jgi:hypothetical protein